MDLAFPRFLADGASGAEVVPVVEAASCGAEWVGGAAEVAAPEPLRGCGWWGDGGECGFRCGR